MIAIRFALIAAAVAVGASGEMQPPRLAGRWTGQTFAAGGPALITLDLLANGTYARRIVTSAEFGWSATPDSLLMAPVVVGAKGQIGYGRASAVELSIAGDEMVESDQWQSITLKRTSPRDSLNPLVGTWQLEYEKDRDVVQHFMADGRLVVTVTISKEAGRWTARKNVIEWEQRIPRAGKKESQFRLKADKLTLYVVPGLPPLELTLEQPGTGS